MQPDTVAGHKVGSLTGNFVFGSRHLEASSQVNISKRALEELALVVLPSRSPTAPRMIAKACPKFFQGWNQKTNERNPFSVLSISVYKPAEQQPKRGY